MSMTDAKTSNKAVIYCRVSSAAQVTKGDGLGSQETRCREYARHRGYEVVEVFRDEGVSGGMIDRPAVQSLLSFLRENRNTTRHIVIIDDISRLARDVVAHRHLRDAIGDAGGKLESPSIEFGEDSDSILVENLLASVSQHHRQKNTEQVINRMRARIMNGYWCFAPPVGYRFRHISGHGKMLVRDEPNATLIQNVLEQYATGRFETATEVLRHLQTCPTFSFGRHRSLNLNLVIQMLERRLYCGFIDVPAWGIALQQGKHEPIISFETYQRIQDRLHGRAKAPYRKDLHPDFPLRGFVTCGCCGEPMTAAWSKGRSASYAYYYCFAKGCPENRKSIRKERLEGEFHDLVQAMTPSESVSLMFRKMVEQLWALKGRAVIQDTAALKTQIATTERKVAQIMERLLNTNDPALITAYEAQVKDLHTDKLLASERIARAGKPRADLSETVRTALDFLSNPYKLWASSALEDQRLMLRLTFGAKLPYLRNEGFRTAETSYPFKVLAAIQGGKCGLVEGAGFEPA